MTKLNPYIIDGIAIERIRLPNERPIRVSLSPDGDIEACFYDDMKKYVVIYVRGGGCKTSTVPSNSDEYRWLVRAARKHVVL